MELNDNIYYSFIIDFDNNENGENYYNIIRDYFILNNIHIIDIEDENEIENITNKHHKYNKACECEKCKKIKINSINKIKIAKMKKFMAEDLCCICLDTKNDNLNKIIDLGCNRKIKHLLCEKCFIEYKKNECPLCKKNINKNNLKFLLSSNK